MSETNQTAKIKIVVPKGCTKQSLNFYALSSHERDLARNTFIYADGRQLLCNSFKVTERNGEKVVVLEIKEECFEIVEGEK